MGIYRHCVGKDAPSEWQCRLKYSFKPSERSPSNGTVTCIPQPTMEYPHSRKCSFEQNTDVINADRGAYAQALSQEQCCTICDRDPECKAAVFGPAGWPNSLDTISAVSS